MHEEYRDFEPGSPAKSYLRVARAALFDPQRFFAAVAGSRGLLRPALFVAASYVWEAALFALPTTLGLAGKTYADTFGASVEGTHLALMSASYRRIDSGAGNGAEPFDEKLGKHSSLRPDVSGTAVGKRHKLL